MFDFLTICRALGDENRLRILLALRERELCVCQITAFLDLAPSTTSKHLSILRQARLIESSKHGRWVYYRLAGERAPKAARDAVAWAAAALADAPAIMIDEKRILRILRAEAECGLGTGSCEEFHSPELHSLDEFFAGDVGNGETFSANEADDNGCSVWVGRTEEENSGNGMRKKEDAFSGLSEAGEKGNGGTKS